MITARDFEVKDAGRVSEILISAFRTFLGNKVDESKFFAPEELKKNANSRDSFHESKIIIAEEDGRILGAVKVGAGTNGLGSFDYVGVDPECHAHGVGAFLMNKAEEFWAEHNQRKISTCVSAHNRKAVMYYLKNDFIPEGYRKDHFFEGVDEIILGRFLKK